MSSPARTLRRRSENGFYGDVGKAMMTCCEDRDGSTKTVGYEVYLDLSAHISIG